MLDRRLPSLAPAVLSCLALVAGLLVAAPASAAPLGLDRLVERLVVRPESPVPFVADPARPPADADGDGCDTREEVLLRDSFLPVETGVGCDILTGTWDVTGEGDYVDDPDEVAVIPWVGQLEAWQSGAHAWTPDQRAAYLDDLELVESLMVGPSWFDSESDGDDPAVWGLESSLAQCDVVAAWALVKVRWNLSVDRAELAALRAVPQTCTYEGPDPVGAGTPVPPQPWAALQADQPLRGGGSLASPDGRYRLQMQTDGNLVVYGPSGATWSTMTSGSGHLVVLQSDGNLVMYDGLGRVAWTSRTDFGRSELLVLQDDGNLVLYALDGAAVWSSQTGRLTYSAPITGPQSSGPGEVARLVSADGSTVLRPLSQGFGVVRESSTLWQTTSPRRIDSFTSTMRLQGDGNLVVADRLGGPLWSSDTRGAGAVRLTVQNDSNLVLYRADGRPVWSWQTGRLAPGPEMGVGVTLGGGGSLVSPGGAYRLAVQPDGNLVVYGPGGTVRWHSGTFGQGAVSLSFQPDGNLVLSTAAGRPLWWTATDGLSPTRLVVQDDGNLVLYRADGRAVWSVATGRL